MRGSANHVTQNTFKQIQMCYANAQSIKQLRDIYYPKFIKSMHSFSFLSRIKPFLMPSEGEKILNDKFSNTNPSNMTHVGINHR